MAKGDYILFNNVPFRSVTSHPRRYGVMFNPSSSRSRLRIIDAGKRYEFRLQSDGTVEYSIDKGANWHTITPPKDPCTDQQFPAFISHDELRVGQALSNYDFDFDFAKEVEAKVRRFCTTDGHIEFGTSLWFEDVVGHRSLADQLVFG